MDSDFEIYHLNLHFENCSPEFCSLIERRAEFCPFACRKFACGHECLLSAVEICQSNFKQPVQISWSPEFCALDDRFLREAWRICECAALKSAFCIIFADRKPDFTVTRILLDHTLDAKSEFWWPLPCLEICHTDWRPPRILLRLGFCILHSA